MFGERAVEIPWLFKNLKAGSVLDIGSDESNYIKQMADEGRSVTQLDTRPLNNNLNTRKIMGDIRRLTADEVGQFDNVLLISTLEHIGLTAYGNQADWKDNPAEEQLRALRHCVQFLNQEGRILLTVPYGKYAHCGWLIIYGRDMIERIKEGHRIISEVYFTVKGEEYIECRQESCPLLGIDVVPDKGMRATSAACLALGRI